MKLTDVNNLTHFGLEDPRMTTIGGVAFRYLDRLPRVGDRVVVDDVALTVLDMDAHRIARVRVAKVSAEEDFEDLSEEEQQELTREFDVNEHSSNEASKEVASEAITDRRPGDDDENQDRLIG